VAAALEDAIDDKRLLLVDAIGGGDSADSGSDSQCECSVDPSVRNCSIKLVESLT